MFCLSFHFFASLCSLPLLLSFFFFFNDTATTEIYTLSLHDALPIWRDSSAMPYFLTIASNEDSSPWWPSSAPATSYGVAPVSRATLLTSPAGTNRRSEEHTSELQSRSDLVCRLLLEKKKKKTEA